MSSKIYARWSREDKIKLLHGVKVYGSRDIHSISKLISNKSPGAIRTMIYRYKILAKETTNSENPLEEWMNVESLKDNTSMIPEALLYISLYEDHPPPSETGGINVRALYDVFYHATVNDTLPELTPTDLESLSKLLEVVKLEITPSIKAEILDYLNGISESSTKPPAKVYSRKKK